MANGRILQLDWLRITKSTINYSWLGVNARHFHSRLISTPLNPSIALEISPTFGTKYSRMDQVKFVEDSLQSVTFVHTAVSLAESNTDTKNLRTIELGVKIL